jgi:hypothetical protein
VAASDRTEGKSKVETIKQYFERKDTPSPGSPVAFVMRKVLTKFPGISFEDARSKAQSLLTNAAGKRRYVTPVVLSDEEQAAANVLAAARLKKVFPKVQTAA